MMLKFNSIGLCSNTSFKKNKANAYSFSLCEKDPVIELIIDNSKIKKYSFEKENKHIKRKRTEYFFGRRNATAATTIS